MKNEFDLLSLCSLWPWCLAYLGASGRRRLLAFGLFLFFLEKLLQIGEREHERQALASRLLRIEAHAPGGEELVERQGARAVRRSRREGLARRRATAKLVRARTIAGELGILPGHTPLLGILVEGDVTIEALDGARSTVTVDGGFLSVDSDVVTIVAEHVDVSSMQTTTN